MCWALVPASPRTQRGELDFASSNRVIRALFGTVVAIGRYKNRRPKQRDGWGDEKDDAVNNLTSFGFWTCATLYTAIGVIGVFFLSTQPNIARSTDGYGTIRLVAQK
jgi:hypothetical protein